MTDAAMSEGNTPKEQEAALEKAPETEAVKALPIKVRATDVNVFYGDNHALKDVTINIPEHRVTAFIGPSGCGKSTFLRCINRMNDTIDICRIEGKIEIDSRDIYDRSIDVVQLRAKVGMVFQSPTRSPNRSMTTSPMAPASTAWSPARPTPTKWSRTA